MIYIKWIHHFFSILAAQFLFNKEESISNLNQSSQITSITQEVDLDTPLETTQTETKIQETSKFSDKNPKTPMS